MADAVSAATTPPASITPGGRPRLSTLMGSESPTAAAAATPPATAVPPPIPAAPAPTGAVVPPPLPGSPPATEPPAVPALRMRHPEAPAKVAAPPPAPAAAGKPAAAPRALASGPKSSKGVALTLGLVVVLLIGGAGYVYFMDPFGLFNRVAAPVAEVPAPTPPVAETPIVPDPVTVTPPPAPEPSPVAVVTPPPVPVETKPAEPPPPPPADPAVERIVAGYVITGARPDSAGGMVMIGGSVHRRGSVVHSESGLTFVGFEEGKLTFRDRNGAIYTRKF